MRVGIVLDPWLTPSVGGGYSFVRETVGAMLGAAGEGRHELVLLTWESSHWSFPGVENVSTLCLDAFPKTCITPETELPELTTLLREAGIDFLWNSSCLATPTMEIPYATPVWDMQHRLQPFFPEVSAGGEWRRRERNYQELLSRAAVVLAGTEAGREEIERFFGVTPERVALLPHPTPADCLEAAPDPDLVARTLERLDVAPGFLFYPAQFWPHKNHVGLLHALRILKDEHGLAPILVLTGSEQGNASHVAGVARDLGLSGHIKNLGFLERADILALYTGAAALAYVSYFGPENLPPLEAFALGCPVLAADVPGAREQLGDAALLVDPADPRAMASGLARLLRAPELHAELAARGRVRARRFTSRDFAAQALALFDRFEPYRRCWA